MSKESIRNIGISPVYDNETETSIRDKGILNTQAATSLKNIFFFLSLVFRYPDATVFAEIRRFLPIFEDFFNEYAGDVPNLPDLEELQAEHIRLFVNGRGHVPAVPYAACYLDGGVLAGENYYRLLEVMENIGIKPDLTAGEPADHLAILLEFASALTERLVAALTSGESGATEVLSALDKVTFRYLRPMITPFWTGITASATFDFYSTSARALHNLLADAETVYTQSFGMSVSDGNITGVET